LHNKRKKRKPEKKNRTLPMTDKEIVLSFVKAINDHDVEKINDLMAEDHVFIDGSGNIHMGKEGMKIGWQSYYQMFPDYIIEISELIEHKSIFGLFGFASGTYKNIKDNSNSNFWKTTAAWKAIVENKKIKHWQVFCDYSRLMEIINKKIN
jgi:ketosteroid isomerase-like protein